MNNTNLDLCMRDSELRAWVALELIIKHYLRKHRNIENVNIVDECLLCFRDLSARMSMMIHFLSTHQTIFLITILTILKSKKSDLIRIL